MSGDGICAAIGRAVRRYERAHGGKWPEKVFISKPVFTVLWREQGLGGDRFIEAAEHGSLTIYGIPAAVYQSDHAEFYLAESRGELLKEAGI